jgi:hypothetical protein
MTQKKPVAGEDGRERRRKGINRENDKAPDSPEPRGPPPRDTREWPSENPPTRKRPNQEPEPDDDE